MNTSVKYIVMADTETGGLPNKDSKAFLDVALIEVACVVVDCLTLSIVDRYSNIIKPYKDGLEYNPKTEETHGITRKMIDELGVDCKVVYKDVKELLKKYTNPRQKAILGGHNFTGFDMPFFEEMFRFYDDDIYNYVKWVEDTQKLEYYTTLEGENYKLGTCCTRHGIELVEAHRALKDTESNAELMISYLKRLRGYGASAVEAPVKEERFRETFQLG